jgi:DNA-binding NarL/FixJ family response regulator
MAELPEVLRVFVLGDDPLARAGIVGLFEGESAASLAGQADGGEQGIELARRSAADVIVWDLGLAPSAALDRLSDQSASLPPVVALIAQEESAAEAWLAGARGLIRREVDGPRLLAAAAAAAQGLSVLEFPPGAVVAGAARATGDEPLTPRETEVLALIAEGLPNKAIAARLGVTEHTAKFHVNAILRKLGAQSRTEAVVLATRRGLLLL